MVRKMHKCKRVSWQPALLRRSYVDCKMTGKRRINWLYSFEWMARKMETYIRSERKKIVWRSRWGFHNNSSSLDWKITKVVSGLWATKHTKFRRTWIILQSLIRERFNGKRKKNTLIVASDGSFVFEPTLIWRSKGPRCFKSLKDPLRPMYAHYFSNKKTWIDSDIIESSLSRLDHKMCLEKRKVVSFWDNATCHPETCR